MKDLGKIISYLVATVVLGTLLAAPLYWGGQWLAAHGILTAFFARVSFTKFFHRGLLVAALVLLWPSARWVRIPNVRALGLAPNPRFWQDAAVGFTASFGLMVALSAGLLASGVVGWRGVIPWWALGKIVVSAVFVAFLEEWLFRGAILGLLTRAMSPRVALFAVSALFSILHFLKPKAPPMTGTVHWLSGFALIPDAFSRFSEPWVVLGGFTTLFCIGWILGWTRLKTRSLAMAMGLHAGWIFGKFGFAQVTRRLVNDTLPWFGEDLSVGLGSVGVVLITGGLIWAWITYGRPQPANGDTGPA